MWADRHGGQIGALSTAASHSGHGQGIEARIILEAARAQLSSTRRTAAVAECCITALIMAFLLGITSTISYNTF